MANNDDAAERRALSDARSTRLRGGMTIHEACVVLGVSQSAVDRWITTGVLTAHRDPLGRDVLSAAAVDDFKARLLDNDAHHGVDGHH